MVGGGNLWINATVFGTVKDARLRPPDLPLPAAQRPDDRQASAATPVALGITLRLFITSSVHYILPVTSQQGLAVTRRRQHATFGNLAATFRHEPWNHRDI
jgi:hypothetical protein